MEESFVLYFFFFLIFFLVFVFLVNLFLFHLLIKIMQLSHPHVAFARVGRLFELNAAERERVPSSLNAVSNKYNHITILKLSTFINSCVSCILVSISVVVVGSKPLYQFSIQGVCVQSWQEESNSDFYAILSGIKTFAILQLLTLTNIHLY